METVLIPNGSINDNCHTRALILLVKIVVCVEFHDLTVFWYAESADKSVNFGAEKGLPGHQMAATKSVLPPLLQWFRGRLVFEAQKLLNHPSECSRTF